MVDATLVRFAVISLGTYALDLAVLTALHGGLGWPLPLALSTGYAVAFATNYLLNRVLNFRSREPIGPESLRYVVVVAVNFAVFLLGGTTLLAALGVPYQPARLVAGACEGVFTYCAMRWFVFSRDRSTGSTAEAPGSRRPTGRAAR
ncbi:GtrA family protein [Nocardioides anomalus]|uniref:GtrA family protein n=1 Tax=Nocardioides anomalus TaxID=2712223 RepID=A0A6G6WJT5_9ACTN|nr:GtrA family protein [Nocardioides anomalus]QIG45504.1 GtrA family protein [Nocardioides anomalus]